MGSVFALSLTSAASPTMLTAVAVILTRPAPKRLLLSFLFGALVIGLSSGLLLVFALSRTAAASTAKHIVSPVADITIGVLILLVSLWATVQHDRLRDWRARQRATAKDKPPPRWQRTLSHASTGTAFLLGIVLALSGAEYIGAMDILSRQHTAIALTVMVVIVFNAIQLLIIEVPTVGYLVRPQAADVTLDRLKNWLHRRGGRAALIAAVVVAVALIARGISHLY